MAETIENVFSSSFFVVAAVICIAVMVFVSAECSVDRRQTRIFLLVVLDVLICALCGVARQILIGYAVDYQIVGNVMLVLWWVYFVVHAALAALFYLYVKIVSGVIYQRSMLKRVLVMMPFFLTETFVVLNPIHHFVYHVNPGFVFCRGWGEIVMYVVSAFYFLMAMAILIFYWQAVTSRRRWALIYSFLIAVATIVLQAMFKDLKVELAGEAMAAAIMMLVVEREDDRIDEATKTYNRSGLAMDINNYLRLRRPFFIIYIRILNQDVLKRMTGSGDSEELYFQVAEFLREIHPKYHIYRSSQNSFSLICLDHNEAEVKELTDVIQDRFSRNFQCGLIEFRLNSMIFWAPVPERLSTVEEIFQVMDSEVSVLNDNQIFTSQHIEEFTRNIALEKAVHLGIEEHNFELCYQPIYSMKDKSIFAAEATLRLKDPELGYIYSNEYMPIVERQGVMTAIQNLLMEEVFSFLGSGIPTELGLSGIAFKLSTEICLHPNFLSTVELMLGKYKVQPYRVSFEIEEPTKKVDYEKLSGILETLRDMGFRIMLDCFGSGYTDLYALTNMRMNMVSISADPLGKEELDPKGQMILKNSVRILRDIHVGIFVRDVSTPEQMKWLEALEVHYFQSDYYSRIVTQNELISILKVTEMARRDEQIARAGSEAKSNFLANMSHEIRTPINAILGMNEMILRESVNPDILSYARDIESAGKSLLAIINDVLDFSKIESGNMEIVPADYDLGSLINDVVTMIQVRARDKGLTFHVDVEEDLPCGLCGDEFRIRQIMINLLNNAVKYTHEGEVNFKVRGAFSSDDELQLICVVSDTGIGIRQEDKSKLFKTFQRLDMNKNRTVEGTGLGLAITGNLVALMRGKVQVDSVYGEGSTFTVSLPQKISDSKPVGDLKLRYQLNQKQRPKYQQSFMAPDAKILVVDDTPMNFTVIKGLLKRTKVQIDTAASGKICLEMCASKVYDLILMDYRMPEMDGVTTLQIMRDMNDCLNHYTPVVVLTANALSGAREHFLAEGFDDYLTKPVDGRKLEECLINFLAKDKLVLGQELEQEVAKEATDAVEDPDMLPQEEREKRKAAEMKAAEGASADATEDEADTEESEDSEEEILVRLQENLGLDTKSGMESCGDYEGYEEILLIYRDSVEAKSAEIESYYQEKDWENYTIQVHALKSTSRLIGAMELSEDAKALEEAGDQKDEAYIEAHTEKLLQDYRDLGERLKMMYPVEEEPEESEGAEDLPEEMFEDGIQALSEFISMMDYDDAIFVLKELSGYRLSDERKQLVKDVKKSIENLDWDAAASLLQDRKGDA